jgi:hypothetical protein
MRFYGGKWRAKNVCCKIFNDWYYKTNLIEISVVLIYVESCTYKFQTADNYFICILPFYLIIFRYDDLYFKSDYSKGALIDKKKKVK